MKPKIRYPTDPEHLLCGKKPCCAYLNVGVLAVHDPDGLAPELDLVQVVDGVDGLLRLSHLDQGRVLLVEQDLHPLQYKHHLKGQSHQLVSTIFSASTNENTAKMFKNV